LFNTIMYARTHTRSRGIGLYKYNNKAINRIQYKYYEVIRSISILHYVVMLYLILLINNSTYSFARTRAREGKVRTNSRKSCDFLSKYNFNSSVFFGGIINSVKFSIPAIALMESLLLEVI